MDRCSQASGAQSTRETPLGLRAGSTVTRCGTWQPRFSCRVLPIGRSHQAALGLGHFYSSFLTAALHPAAPSIPALPTGRPLSPPPAQSPPLPLGSCRVPEDTSCTKMAAEALGGRPGGSGCCRPRGAPTWALPQSRVGISTELQGRRPAQRAKDTGLQPSMGHFLPELVTTVSPWGWDR